MLYLWYKNLILDDGKFLKCLQNIIILNYI